MSIFTGEATRSGVIGVDLGVGRLTWGVLRPMVHPKKPGEDEAPRVTIGGVTLQIEKSGDLGKLPHPMCSTDNIHDLLHNARGHGQCGRCVVEFPDERFPGQEVRYGNRYDGTLLELAGHVADIAEGLGYDVLRKSVGDIRQWAAGTCAQLAHPAGERWNWSGEPDASIKAFWLACGASQHCIKAKGVLSNEDKRDALLAAAYGACNE